MNNALGTTMDDSSALVSLAMLKVDSDVQGRDYIDYLTSFVFYILEKYKPEPVTSGETQRLLKEEFKLRIPIYPTELVLRRLAKRKYLDREHSLYKIVKSMPSNGIDTLRSDARNRTESVIGALREFAASVHSVTWSEEDATSAIAAYLTHFSVDCLKSYAQKTALPEVKLSSGQQNLFIVNTFVICLKEKLPAIFENMIVLVKGQLLTNALICSDLESIPRKFNGVTFYLDTPVILQLFGLEGKTFESAVSELVELLRNLKGTIAVFEHTVQEVHGVIEGCERNIDNPHARGGLVITEMRRAGKTSSDIALTKARLTDLYKKFEISKRTTPTYIPSLQIDESILHHALQLVVASDSAGEVPFRLYRDYAIVVRGSIGNLTNLNFLIDTGAVPSVLDRRIARKLRLAGTLGKLSVFTQKLDTEQTSAPNVQLGQLHADALPVVVRDLSLAEQALGTRVDAMIGFDFLGQTAFTIDYLSRKIVFGPIDTSMAATPYQSRPGYVVVEMQIQQRQLLLLVDTGARDLTFFERGVRDCLS